MLPISLVVVTDAEKMDDLRRCLKSVEGVVSETVIVYQGRDHEKKVALEALSSFVAVTSKKGNADPDRAFAYSLPTQPWVLSLDDDEYLSEETARAIARVLMTGAEVVWFDFKNLVDGVDIKEILGDDPHPRLWVKRDGLIIWPSQAHAFPTINSPNQVFLKHPIIHSRSYADIVKRHEERTKVIGTEAVQLEKRFIDALSKKLGKTK